MRPLNLIKLLLVIFAFNSWANAQTKLKPTEPPSLPYSFSNFPWWSDDELRTALKQLAPYLEDRIPPHSKTSMSVRALLEHLLREKGIQAIVLVTEYTDSAVVTERTSQIPEPFIEYSIFSPKILFGHITCIPHKAISDNHVFDNFRLLTMREYRSDLWYQRTLLQKELARLGYMDSKVLIKHDIPRFQNGTYLVDTVVEVEAGQQYRISALTVDGGPLLAGMDLTSYYDNSPGSITDDQPFKKLEKMISSIYQNAGYKFVRTHTIPTIDKEKLSVSFKLTVTPGTQYHLRRLYIEGLDKQLAEKVRSSVLIKPGDIYVDETVSNSILRIKKNELPNEYDIATSFRRDDKTGSVDLTLIFNTKH